MLQKKLFKAACCEKGDVFYTLDGGKCFDLYTKNRLGEEEGGRTILFRDAGTIKQGVNAKKLA